jgi:hypothetical protein
MPKVQKGHDHFVNILIKLELCKMLQMLQLHPSANQT